MKSMERFAKWFLDDFKPLMMAVCRYVGLLTVYFFVASLLFEYFKLSISVSLPLLVIGGFVIDNSSKEIILEAKIKKIIGGLGDALLRIVDGNLINYSELRSISGLIANKLKEDGYYKGKSTSLNDASDWHSKVSKMIDKCIWEQYYRLKPR